MQTEKTGLKRGLNRLPHASCRVAIRLPSPFLMEPLHTIQLAQGEKQTKGHNWACAKTRPSSYEMATRSSHSATGWSWVAARMASIEFLIQWCTARMRRPQLHKEHHPLCYFWCILQANCLLLFVFLCPSLFPFFHCWLLKFIIPVLMIENLPSVAMQAKRLNSFRLDVSFELFSCRTTCRNTTVVIF